MSADCHLCPHPYPKDCSSRQVYKRRAPGMASLAECKRYGRAQREGAVFRKGYGSYWRELCLRTESSNSTAIRRRIVLVGDVEYHNYLIDSGLRELSMPMRKSNFRADGIVQYQIRFAQLCRAASRNCGSLEPLRLSTAGTYKLTLDV